MKKLIFVLIFLVGLTTVGFGQSKVATAKKDRPEFFMLRPAVEKQYGYTHAVRIGDELTISGAVSMDDKGNLVADGNLEQQMKNCYSDLAKILKHFGYTF